MRHTHGSEGRREGARLLARWSAYVDGTIRVVIDVMVPGFRQELSEAAAAFRFVYRLVNVEVVASTNLKLSISFGFPGWVHLW